MPNRHVDNKRCLRDALMAIAEAAPGQIGARLAAIYHPEAEWRGSHPINEMRGTEAMAA